MTKPLAALTIHKWTDLCFQKIGKGSTKNLLKRRVSAKSRNSCYSSFPKWAFLLTSTFRLISYRNKYKHGIKLIKLNNINDFFFNDDRNSREDSLWGDSIKHEAPNSPYLAASIRDSDTLQPFWGAVSSGQYLCLSLVVSPGHLPSSIINGQILHISSMHAFKVPCYAGRALGVIAVHWTALKLLFLLSSRS